MWGRLAYDRNARMSVAPSRREMKKTAHKVAKHVNEAVEDLTEALGM